MSSMRTYLRSAASSLRPTSRRNKKCPQRGCLHVMRRLGKASWRRSNSHAYVNAAEPIYYHYIYFWCKQCKFHINDFVKQFVDALGSRFEESQKLTQDLHIYMNLQLNGNKGKKLAHDYSTETPNANSSAAHTGIPEYGMPQNNFAGQSPPLGSVWPTTTHYRETAYS